MSLQAYAAALPSGRLTARCPWRNVKRLPCSINVQSTSRRFLYTQNLIWIAKDGIGSSCKMRNVIWSGNPLTGVLFKLWNADFCTTITNAGWCNGAPWY